jgi:threonine dehydratase
VFVGVTVNSRDETQALIETLEQHGLRALDLSQNEMAKLHIRHMVGGHASHATYEQLYRFEFPERPGALMTFLNSMSPNWNISLFHYRNHGADPGRVLVGIQVPPEDHLAFQTFLDKIGYAYSDESQNPAYHLFVNATSRLREESAYGKAKPD